MLLIQCVNAYAAALAMMQQEWDYETAHALVLLKTKLQPHVDFFTSEELKLVEEFAVKNTDRKTAWNGNGTFTFAQPERAQEYTQRRTKLGAVEVDEDWRAMKVPRPASIKPVHLEALEGFIQFGENGGGGK